MAGATLNQLAKKHRMGNRRVRRIIKAAGVLRPHGKGRAYTVPEETARALKDDYAAGSKLYVLMQTYRIGYDKLCATLEIW